LKKYFVTLKNHIFLFTVGEEKLEKEKKNENENIKLFCVTKHDLSLAILFFHVFF
jgi:hypothetical protein